MEILVDDFGSYLGKKSERLIIRRNDRPIEEIPFFDLERIIISSKGVSLSSDLIRECAERGVAIHFLSSRGQPYAQVSAPNLSGTVRTRREQILAFLDGRGIMIGKLIIAGKVKNQINLLKYFAKYRKTAEPELFGLIEAKTAKMAETLKELGKINGNKIDEVRPCLLSVEGRAAALYWECFGALIAKKHEFPGREHQGAADPVNSLLNYGYGMLYTQVWGAVVQAGLEPFAGFLHVDRPGKPSLVLDLTEEFRPMLVDRVVLAYIGKGAALKMDGERLADETRKEFAQKIMERWDETGDYERKKVKLRQIILMQARHFATFLRGESKYKPFAGSW
ncbi:MAG: CRISPR-associated endonuclease Cas1 [Firmicutes bacterium]|nr:CRISPR-associated endonuclease Cas1 [Bacillota bacterium]